MPQASRKLTTSELEQLFSSLELKALDSLPGAVLLFNAEGEVLFANSAFKEMMGYHNEENYLATFEKVFHKSSLAKARQIWPLMQNRSNSLSETGLFVRRRSGKKTEVTLNMKWAAGPTGEVLVATFHDLTELRRVQGEREYALHEINRMAKLADLGRLSAGVAHEMNNPLMIIRGFAESLQQDLLDHTWDPERAQGHVQRILQAADRMSKITTNMMKLARDEEPLFRITDLAEVTQETLLLLTHKIEDAKVDLDIIYATSDRTVRCEAGQIGQILINIVQNALHSLSKSKHHQRNLRLEIRRSDESDVMLQLAIWNNGPAIPEKLKGHIMTPFFSTKPAGEGVGLGLAICQGIMDQHGGKLFFTSDQDKGTEFVLEFPAASAMTRSEPRKKLNILVLDDEPFIVDLLKERFHLLGHNVQAFTQAQSALKSAAKESYDVAFVDLRMPDQDGWEVLSQLAAFPTISLYAMSGFHARQQRPEIPLKRILNKPFDIAVLLSLLEEEMDLKVKAVA